MASNAAVALLTSYLWGRYSDRLGRRKPLIVGGLAGLALAYLLLGRATSAEMAWGVRMWEAVVQPAYFTISLAMVGDLLSRQDGSQGADHRGQRMGTYRGVGSVTFAIGALTGGRLADRLSMGSVFLICAGLYALAGLVALAVHEILPARGDRSEDSVPAKSIGAKADRSRKLPLAFLGGVFLWTVSLSAFSSMSPNYLARLGYTKGAISSLWGLAAIAEAPVMRWVGQISDMVGRAPVLAFSSFSLALVLIGYVFLATSLAGLIGVQLGRGVSYASFMATSMVFTAEVGDRRNRGGNAGLYSAATGGGQLMGLLAGGTLAQARGFDFMFWICVAVALLSGICFLALWRGTPRPLTAGAPRQEFAGSGDSDAD